MLAYMDVLSDVIAVMRTGEPRSARVTWHAPWGQRFAPVPGAAGFQIILSGTCTLFPEGGGDPVPLSTGDILFLPHGSGHALGDGSGPAPAGPACDPRDGGRFEARHTRPGTGPATVTLCGAYELDPRRVHPLLAELPPMTHLPAHVGRHPELRAAVELLGGEVGRTRPGGEALVRALLETLLVYILRACMEERTASAGGWGAALADPGVAAALAAVHAEPGRQWTVGSLGAAAGMSRAAFSRRFGACTGRTPLSYVTWWRMTVAARLLRDGRDPLAAIARRVGYASEYAFAHAFKREFGVAPGRFRRESAPPGATLQ